MGLSPRLNRADGLGGAGFLTPGFFLTLGRVFTPGPVGKPPSNFPAICIFPGLRRAGGGFLLGGRGAYLIAI